MTFKPWVSQKLNAFSLPATDSSWHNALLGCWLYLHVVLFMVTIWLPVSQQATHFLVISRGNGNCLPSAEYMLLPSV